MLTDVEHIIVNAYESSRSKYEGLLNALKGNLDIVVNNKKELQPEPTQAAQSTAPKQPEEEFSQDDFNFDENTFLEDIE